MSLIVLKDIRKVYDLGEVQVVALQSATLTIERGEYVALIGPSGSGKSTLMNTLGCLDRPTSGSYFLDGEDVLTKTKDQRAKIRNEHLGFVFQNFNLLSRTSAVENVELPLLYKKGVSAKDRRTRASEALESVGLADRLHHHPSQLSGGQQQRVAIARALVNNPSILMGDEPTGNLDSKTSRDVIHLFRELNTQKNLTVIIVTHDQNVGRHADRVVVMHDGLIAADSHDFDFAMQSLQSLELDESEQESSEIK
ncbi:MAG: ABC transporter ATP-binding protein [Planctomycetaceae bacterium]|nr:ABC transporter ATP-binding protein [Planctomycetaceae bacterium]